MSPTPSTRMLDLLKPCPKRRGATAGRKSQSPYLLGRAESGGKRLSSSSWAPPPQRLDSGQTLRANSQRRRNGSKATQWGGVGGVSGGQQEAKYGVSRESRRGLKATVPLARSRSESKNQGGSELLGEADSEGWGLHSSPGTSWALPPPRAQASGPTLRESAVDSHSRCTASLRTFPAHSARPTCSGKTPSLQRMRQWPGPNIGEPPDTTEKPQQSQLEPACDPPVFVIMPATSEALWEIC